MDWPRGLNDEVLVHQERRRVLQAPRPRGAIRNVSGKDAKSERLAHGGVTGECLHELVEVV